MEKNTNAYAHLETDELLKNVGAELIFIKENPTDPESAEFLRQIKELLADTEFITALGASDDIDRCKEFVASFRRNVAEILGQKRKLILDELRLLVTEAYKYREVIEVIVDENLAKAAAILAEEDELTQLSDNSDQGKKFAHSLAQLKVNIGEIVEAQSKLKKSVEQKILTEKNEY